MAFGTIGSAVLDLLKLLTPSEIKRLTEFKVGQKGLSKRKLRISSVGEESDKFSEVSAHSTELETSHNNVLPFSKHQNQQQVDDPYKENSTEVQQQTNKVNSVSVSSFPDSGQVFDPLMVFEVKPESSENKPISTEIILPNIELTKTEEMLEKAGIMSASKIDYLKKIQDEKERQGRQSTSIFLILEREKLAKSLSAMKKIEVLQAYKEESLVDIELEKYSNTQDLTTNPGSGVLVNRKHY